MSKDKLFELYTPNDIYAEFLGFSEFPNKNISSPFSEDKNPSFRLYTNGTFKCFSTGKQGDVFQFVGDLFGLDCKRDFSSIIEIITQKLNLSLDSQRDPILNGNGTKNSLSALNQEELHSDTKNNHFSYLTKPLDTLHCGYWMQGNWGVTKDLLDKYKVKALEEFEFWNNAKEEIQKIKLYPGVIGFAYELGASAEIYIPKQEKNKKFFLNKTSKEYIFGFEQLSKKVKHLIVCAGKKDCLILNANGFTAVSFRSENHFITKEQLKLLRSKSDNLFICYDNDTPGKEAMERAVKEYQFIPIPLPKQINDVADYFLGYSKENFSKLVQEPFKKRIKPQAKKNMLTDAAEYLNSFYAFRFNVILNKIEYREIGNFNWDYLDSIREERLFMEVRGQGFTISSSLFLSILKGVLIKEYNPIEEYFTSLSKWDQKTDYISILANYVDAIEKDQFAYQFKKWCVRVVKCAIEKRYFNKQALIFVQKEQNSGKTSFFRFLCPPELVEEYFSDSLSTEKDGMVKLCKNFLINLDELNYSKNDLKTLKSMFSLDKINERLPYDRSASFLPRIASFVGSTNEADFLNDDSGSVRWLCFQINGINWKYSEEFKIRNLWAQAYYLAYSGFDCEFSREDIEENQKRNEKFQKRSLEEELVSKYIEKSDKEYGEFCTASDITVYLNALGVKLNHSYVGRALNALGLERIKNSKRQVYGYYIKKLPLFEMPGLN